MQQGSKSFWRLGAWIALILAIPVVPFLGFGEALERQFVGWLDESLAPGAVALMVVGLLAVDILLPVPSSVVSAFAGKALGFWGGMAASWCGMTLGACIAFALVRWLGRRMAERFATAEDLAAMDAMAARVGVYVLALARPVPLLAEVSVLMMATTQLAWWRFLLAVGLSNLGVAAAYAALGGTLSMPAALLASIALPLLAGAVARLVWPTTSSLASESSTGDE